MCEGKVALDPPVLGLITKQVPGQAHQAALQVNYNRTTQIRWSFSISDRFSFPYS